MASILNCSANWIDLSVASLTLGFAFSAAT
jgi:hypothetical protein